MFYRPLMIFLLLAIAAQGFAAEIMVSADGRAASLPAAQRLAREMVKKSPGEPVTVTLAAGVYYLPETFVFTAEDSGTTGALVTYRGEVDKEVVISGGMKLALEWTPWRDRILKAKAPAGFATDQLFVNGERMVLARFPDFDAGERIFNGWAADAFAKERAARWANSAGGFIHAMHRSMWGGYSYRITGKDSNGEVSYEGGWQNNRQMGMHADYRHVENIFEELDAPGEWFLDEAKDEIYFYPPDGIDVTGALCEAPALKRVIEFRGTQAAPVHHVRLEGVAIRHALRTFMDTKEPLLRSDWTIAREGAVFFEGAEDCAIVNCLIDQVGGNAVFASKYNRRVTVKGCEIDRAGGSGVAFVGDPDAVRSPLFEYRQRQSSAGLDLTPGPKTENYPRDCEVVDSLIHEIGRVEKQCAGVQISMARGISVADCTIYGVPRAGINIGDGCWGGHVIEGCDVFDTVLETGDHGAFNSWGRDRWWGLTDLRDLSEEKRLALTKLDTIEPIVIRNSRWRCDHGWDIDLDDGATNYRIYNNVGLGGGIKLREGYGRVLENNVMVNNTFHPHVWFEDSGDVVRRNIVFEKYRPIRVAQPWGAECDRNLLHEADKSNPQPAAVLQQLSGRDQRSLIGDALFMDATNGDWRVKDDSPATALGFKNFAMDQFGVKSPRLKARARKPSFEKRENTNQVLRRPRREPDERVWMGMRIKNLIGLGELSATGMGSETGVLVQEANDPLKAMDVIIKIQEEPVNDIAALRRVVAANMGKTLPVTVQREQQMVVVDLIIEATVPD